MTTVELEVIREKAQECEDFTVYSTEYIAKCVQLSYAVGPLIEALDEAYQEIAKIKLFAQARGFWL